MIFIIDNQKQNINILITLLSN